MGRVERKVLEGLRSKENRQCELTSLVWWIAGRVASPGADYPEDLAFVRPYQEVPNVYKSVVRAVRSLERRGLVRVVRKRPKGSCPFGRRCPSDRGLMYPFMVVELVE